MTRGQPTCDCGEPLVWVSGPGAWDDTRDGFWEHDDVTALFDHPARLGEYLREGAPSGQ